jgi:hypothetical protein
MILGLIAMLVAETTLVAAEPPVFLVKAEISNGVQAISFSSSAGVIRVYLPDDIRPGDMISGTIGHTPQGATPEARAANKSILAGCSVEIGQRPHRVITPAVGWSIPATLPPGGIALVLRNDQGAEVARTPLAVTAREDRASKAFRLPAIGQTGRLLEVTGPFDGDLSTTDLKLEDEPIELIAESPRKLIARNSYTKKGMALLVLRERDKTADADYRSIAVNLAAPKTALLKGEKTTLTVKVAGLELLTKGIPLVLENTSSDVITLSGGDAERFRIEPSSVVGGSVTIERTVTGIKHGSWTISCTVVKDE